MKHIHLFVFLACMVMVSALALPSTTLAAEGIKWYSYDEGLALGKADKKKVYINFYADWCGYCRKMEKETFQDSRVISFLNQNYISIRINSDKEKKLSRQYNVSGLPANIFVSDTGENIGNQPGYLGPADFMKVITFVYEEKYKPKTK